jgi:2'-5' RNA ligase
VPTKRLFVAAFLPSAVERHLVEHSDGLRTAHPELRWVAPSRWHLTLEFLGDCGPHELERQRERWARRAARSEPFELSLHEAGAFPRAWNARVLWVGIAGDLRAFERLAAHGQAPHLTLARTREARDLTGVVDELSSYRGPSWTIGEIALVESHLRGATDRGPRYQPLERFSLGTDDQSTATT